jgi:succinoglycan biosynthesis transport protein ExoP
MFNSTAPTERMLQIPNVKPITEFSIQRPTATSPAELVGALVGLVRRRLGIIAALFGLSLLCGLVYLALAPPRFLAEAELLIDTKKSEPFPRQQATAAELTMDSAAVDSQIQVLKSEGVAATVVKDLHLTADPEFVGAKPGLFGTILGYLGVQRPPSESELERRARAVFENGLAARRIGTTYVIQVGFLSLNPERAAQVANATADAYIVDQLQAKYEATRRASTWLQERIQELRQQASTAENAVLDFKKANNIVDTGGRLINEQQLAELNSQLVTAQSAAAEAKARLDRISEITKKDVSDIDNILRAPDPAVADALHNDVINKLRSEFLEIANKEGLYSAQLGRNHLLVVNLRNQMFEIRRSIMDELKRIAETFKSDYQIAITREQSIEKNLADAVSQNQTTNQAQVKLKDLDSNAQTYRTLHDMFVQRYMESLQQQSFPFTEARVITHAVKPLTKNRPNSVLVVAAASVGGLLLAFGAALLIDISEGGFRTSEQVEQELQTSCLTIVPAIKAKIDAPLPGSERKKGRSWRRPEPKGVLSGVISNPFSRFAEAFRGVKVAIDLFSLARPNNKAIGITSTYPGEGKSSVAANLARLIAHAGGKAILLDCDLRNPSLTHSLAPGAEVGLLDVISGKASLRDAVWHDPATSLAFLPMIAKARLPHSNEILASPGMKKLIESLREVYDYVLVDLPPLNPVVDVRSTSQIIDSYLFVIEWGQTGVDAVRRALGSAPLVYESLIGVILNKADLDAIRRYSRGAGDNYKNEYFERYGFKD